VNLPGGTRSPDGTPAPVTLAIIGAGNRGADVYGEYALRHPEAVRVVAVADPRRERRERLAIQHGVPPERCYLDAEALLTVPRLADVAIVATPDAAHVEPTVGALAAGYEVLLEKPIATGPAGLERLAAAASGRPGAVTVAHVLRYTDFFTTVAELLATGAIGRLQGIEHTEDVGFWHFAHSYVRGNWRRADQSSPLILAKACHDLDLVRWLVGAPCVAVASFGERGHFRASEAPDGAPDRCLDGCPATERCPHHAGRFYLEQLGDWNGPPVTIVTDDLSPAGRLAALREGPYGRCVYRCDNDVPDHQVTILAFTNGVSATLTVTAFSQRPTRRVRYLGSLGELRGDLDAGVLELARFVSPPGTRPAPALPVERIQMTPDDRVGGAAPWGAFVGHAGGDDALMDDLVGRWRDRRTGWSPVAARTSLAASLDSHRMAFAAETSRLTGQVVHLTGHRRPTGP
jgi:predicted dehydrogenase